MHTTNTLPAVNSETFARLALAKALSDHFKKIYDDHWALVEDMIHEGESVEASVGDIPFAQVQLTSRPTPTFTLTDAEEFARACESAGVQAPLVRECSLEIHDLDGLVKALKSAGVDVNDYGVLHEKQSLAPWADRDFFALSFDDIPEGISVKQAQPSRRVKFNKDGVHQLLGRFNTEKVFSRITQ